MIKKVTGNCPYTNKEQSIHVEYQRVAENGTLTSSYRMGQVRCELSEQCPDSENCPIL